jgi:hypothetical protein
MNRPEPEFPSDEEPRATRPISHDQSTQALPTGNQRPDPPARVPGASCKSGHDQPDNPTWHPTLGLVPAMTSVVFGAMLLVAIFALEIWLLPVLIGWTVALLAFGLFLSGIAQFALGHRSSCWLWRTLRWWIGPIGTLVDPIEMG